MANEKFYAGGFLYNPVTKSVLLHKRDFNTKINPNKWAFFGGLNEGEERPVETFVREVKEELNIDVDINKVKELCNYYNEELETYRYVFFVESELDKSEMKLGEGAGFDWVPIEKVFEYDLTDKTKIDLEIFINNLSRHCEKP